MQRRANPTMLHLRRAACWPGLLATSLGLAACCPPPQAKTSTLTSHPLPATDATQAPAVVADFAAAGIDWRTPPVNQQTQAFTPPAPTVHTLPNGSTLLVVENPRLPLVSLRVVFANAGSRDDGNAHGIASLTGDMLDEGAGRFSAEALPEELERLGASLDVSVGPDATTIHLAGIEFERSASLLADVILRPTLAQADFDRVKADRLAELAQRKDSPREIANLIFDRIVFGQHPYGAPTEGTVASVKQLDLPQVKAFWQRAIVAGQPTFVVVGNITAAQAQAKLSALFGAMPAAKAAPNQAPRVAPVAGPTKPMLAFVHRPDAPQSVVVIGKRTMLAEANRAAGDVLNTALGGSFASRLNAKLREELGYTYGIRSVYWRGRWGGTWSIRSSLRTDATAPGISEIFAIVNAVRNAPVPAAEWSKTQDLMIRGLPQDFETNAGIGAAFATAVAVGDPLNSYAEAAAKWTAATPATAQAIAKADWQDLSVVIVGDEQVLKGTLATLQASGLPLVRFDAEGAPLDPLPTLPAPSPTAPPAPGKK